MKILKNKTYNCLEQSSKNLGEFLRVITRRLRELEENGKAQFIKNEPGSGISEWKINGRHLYFNEFPNKFKYFTEFITLKDDEEKMAHCQNFTYYDLIKFLFK